MWGNGEGGRARARKGEVGGLRQWRSVLLRLLGMPDYEAYLAHLRTRHPERQVPSEREFFEQYLRYRYEGGATRCC